MSKINQRELGRIRRHIRVRKKVFGTKERPRLSLHKSINNLYAQLIDDINGKTLYSLSTQSPKIKTHLNSGGNVKAAQALGELLAKEAGKIGINKVTFDRAGNLYHGRIKAFAESARKNGLVF